jgi:branched-chain amino acid transport system substrate-binding protein
MGAYVKVHALADEQEGSPLVYALNDPYVFSTNVPVVNQMVPFASWVLSQPGHPTTAAYPMVADPFADPPVQHTMSTFQKHGIKTVYVAPTIKGQIGYANLKPSALAQDARVVARKNAGIVVLGSVDVPTVSIFMHVFASMHYTPKIFIAAAGPDGGQVFLNAVGTGNAIGMMVPNGWYGAFPNSLSHVMVQDYIAKYGGSASDINADVAESYSAAQTLQAAVEATGGTVQSKLVSWLHRNPVQTVLGEVKFKSNGENADAEKSALIFQWQPAAGGTGAKFVQVLPGPPRPGSVKIIATKPPLSG